MKKLCLIVGIGLLFCFVGSQRGLADDDQVLKRQIPRIDQKYTSSELAVDFKPSESTNVSTDQDSSIDKGGNHQVKKNKPPKVKADYAPGEIIVKFKPDVSEQVIDELNAGYGVSIIYSSPFAKFKRLKVPGTKQLNKMLEDYRNNPDVEYAELNYIASAYSTPNDLLYSYQWHLDNPEYGGINMEEAWELLGAPGTPGENVVVAVVDSGVAYEDYPAPDHWHIDTYNAYGGSGYSWWCGVSTAPSSWYYSSKSPPGYGNGWKDYLQHSFDLTAAVGTVTFSFYYKYDIERGYDFFYVDISDNGGGNWTNLITYTNTSGPPGGKPVDWKLGEIDLTSYAGSDILIRFRFNSDDSYSDEDGYFNSDGAVFIDEVKLEDGSGILFYDDVESGAGSWEVTRYEKAPDLAETSFLSGYDFVNDDSHANDDEGHGTHVAGTVAQSTNNYTGVAGVAFNCSIMPVKVLGSDGSGLYSWIADGIMWAVDNGAHIINLSLGGTSSNITLESAVAYAYNNGVTVIAASGNAGSGSIDYPAAYDNYVIAVGATQYDESRAPYSNYGSSLDIVAPGGNTGLDQNGDGYADGVLQNTFSDTPVDWSYWFYQGTSMAAPHVSGVAALLISYGQVSTPDEVRSALQDTADDLGAPGPDNIYGHGLVNAYAVLMDYTAVSLVYFQDWEIGEAGLYSMYDGWHSKYYYTISPDYDPISIIIDTDPSHGKVHEITRVDAATNYLSPLIEVTAGQRYVVDAWIKWVGGGWPFIGISRYNEFGSPIGLPLYDPGTAPRLIWLIGKGDYHTMEGYTPFGDWVTPVPIVDGWNYYEKIFTVPDGTAYVRIMTELWKGASRSGDPLAYFDDIVMYAVVP